LFFLFFFFSQMPAPVAFSNRGPASGIAVGFNKGHIVTRRKIAQKPSRRKGLLGDRIRLIRGVIRDVSGYSPYERRLMEILRGGGSNPTKRAWKFAKKRLGTHIRAKRKVVEMGDVISANKKMEAQAKAQQTQQDKAAAAQSKGK